MLLKRESQGAAGAGLGAGFGLGLTAGLRSLGEAAGADDGAAGMPRPRGLGRSGAGWTCDSACSTWASSVDGATAWALVPASRRAGATRSADIGGAARGAPATTAEAPGADAAPAVVLAAVAPAAPEAAACAAFCAAAAASAAACGMAVALAMVAVLPVENTLGVSTGGCGWGWGAVAASSAGHLP